MTMRILLISLFVFTSSVYAEAKSQGTYYVTTGTLNVRLEANPKGQVTNKLYRQQKLQVYEVQDGWARVSKYYDGSKEGFSGDVARWVFAKYLSKERPSDRAQPKLKSDPRINGLPKVGQYGATGRDIHILYAAAQHFLKIGKCKKIEYGDKSTSKVNTYYLNCGSRNNYFQPSDIPGLSE